MSLPIPAQAYGAILADPPWAFVTHSDAGLGKSPQRHYPCMPTAAIKALSRELLLDFICAPDCALIMWATFPMLPDAFEVMRAWGFAYKSGGAWAKMAGNGNPAFGPGYLYRSASEIWLLGTRGAPAVRSHSVRNLIIAPRREHSRKPVQMHQDIERLFDGPYLELFARGRPRRGWTIWGNEALAEEPAEAPALEQHQLPVGLNLRPRDEP